MIPAEDQSISGRITSNKID